MSNPYLPIPFNENDFGLAIFQPDMVLTHEQLNTIFGYLMQQNTRTRTHLIGVGVVCGLEPKRVGDTIEISRGCGVTTEGDLISFQENRAYTQFLPYILADHTPYAPFQTINGLQLWELFPAEFPDDQPKQNLTELDLDDKVVMLYLESQRKAADRCTGVDCDNQGDRFLNRLHVLLVRRTDAELLIEKAHRQAAMACTKLPRLRSRRVGIDNRPYNVSLASFSTLIRIMYIDFGKTIENAYTLLDKVLTLENPTFAFTSSINNTFINEFKTKIKASTIDNNVSLNDNSSIINTANIQYLYDWLKDLYDAYEEFREATCCWLTMCVPDESWFPKHLLLGELKPTSCKLEYRHYFLRSPAVLDCKDGKDKAIWLFQRIIHLIQNFKIPQSTQEFDLTEGVDSFINISKNRLIGKRVVVVPIPTEITPSLTRNAPLGERAMPFYYTPETRKFWSYEKTKKCQEEDILSYHTTTNSPIYVNAPFDYDIDKLSFYRIEGTINKGYNTVLRELIALRKTYNLAFSIVGISLSARVITRLSSISGRVVDNTGKPLAGVSIQLKGTQKGTTTKANGDFKLDISEGEEIVISSAGYLSKIVSIDGDFTKIILEKDNKDTSDKSDKTSKTSFKVVADANAQMKKISSTAGKKEEFTPAVEQTVSAVEAKSKNFKNIEIGEFSSLADQTATSAMLAATTAAAQSVVSTFEKFQIQHPGMEHLAGVHRGGTFILVYSEIKGQGNIVVADFQLPYFLPESV